MDQNDRQNQDQNQNLSQGLNQMQDANLQQVDQANQDVQNDIDGGEQDQDLFTDEEQARMSIID